jgi:hypothetical protein
MTVSFACPFAKCSTSEKFNIVIMIVIMEQIIIEVNFMMKMSRNLKDVNAPLFQQLFQIFLIIKGKIGL